MSDSDYFSDSEEEEVNFEKENIRSKIKARLKSNLSPKNDSLIAPIHEDIVAKYNSVNVIVGKQSMGKTVTALEEIIKISILNTHHLLVYVTKDGEENDKSWLSLKPLLQMPTVVVSEKDAEKCIDELLAAKSLYYKIRRERTKNKISQDQLDDLFNVLFVEDFDREYLHSIVLFDDISNSKLFSSEESFFSQLLRRCRHTNMSYFLLVQGWKGLKPHIKNEISTLYLLPGFNKQQLRYIYSQAASNLDFEDFFDAFQQLNEMKHEHPDEHPMIVIQCSSGGDTYIRS